MIIYLLLNKNKLMKKIKINNSAQMIKMDQIYNKFNRYRVKTKI